MSGVRAACRLQFWKLFGISVAFCAAALGSGITTQELGGSTEWFTHTWHNVVGGLVLSPVLPFFALLPAAVHDLLRVAEPAPDPIDAERSERFPSIWDEPAPGE